MSNHPLFPVSNATTPFWRTQLDDLDSHRTTEQLPSQADIAIVGAGYSGAAIAHHLLEKTKSQLKGPSIVILEAREACSGATARNGGHLRPNSFSTATSILESHGAEAAEEVAAFEAKHINAIKNLVTNDQIDCAFTLTKSADVAMFKAGGDRMKSSLDKLNRAGISTVSDIHYTSEETAENDTGIKGAKGFCSSPAGHLWPYKLILHLLRKAVQQGVNLQTHTPVKSVSQTQDSEGRWTVTTAHGEIKAKQVVYANNGYVSALIPELKEKIIPSRGICCHIVTPKSKPAPKLPTSSYALRYEDGSYDYLIQRPDGTIIVGGGRKNYYKDLDQWYNNIDDSTLIEPAKPYYDGFMQRTFHGWEDSEAYVDQIWTGIMGYSHDDMPYIGEVPNKPGQFLCAGFTGHGMPLIFLSAECLASTIVEGKPISETGLPRMYQISSERMKSERNAVLEGWESFNLATKKQT